MNGYELDRRPLSLGRGKAKKGDVAAFQCRRKIIKRKEGNLTDVLREDNYKNIISSANTLQEAINYIKKLYGTTEGIFAAHAMVYCKIFL